MKNYRDMAQDVLRRAEEERQVAAKRRKRLALSVAPAVCALAALAILLLPKRTQPPVNQAQTTSDTPLAAVLEKLELPAQALAEPVFVTGRETPQMTQAELAGMINANVTVQGVVSALDTARVRSADGTVWYLASAAIRVDEVLTGTAPDELRIVCAAALGGGADEGGDEVPIPQLAECRVGMESVFVLRPVDAESVWSIDGKEISPKELGDYSILCRLEKSGNRLLHREQGLSVLYVPPVKLPEPEEGVEIDMIGFVVYNGAIYTQTADYFGEDAEALRGLLGKKLGHASGSVDEWSSADAYEQEFASGVAGDVCTMQGYSPEFRLCLVNEEQNEDGAPLLWIQVLEHLNGIGVCTGAELFSERLRLDGRVVDARTQSFDDWNNARERFRTLQLGPELEAFLAVLNEGEVTDVPADDPVFSLSGGERGFLYLDLDDGTSVSLYLYAGGLVVYAGLPRYPVRVPDAVFAPVFALCD